MKIKNYPLKSGQWLTQVIKKKYVVWHATEGRTSATPANGQPGRATTSIDTWNSNPDRIGAPWLVDRDGTIYKTFDDKEWIYHLGIKGVLGKFDKISAGIEIANEGVLQRNGAKLYAFGNITPNTEYKGKSFERKWRKGQYWASLDETQVDACIELTLDICNRNSIDPVFYYPSTSYAFPQCFDKATILTHSNCREDKTDLILEDWVWDKIKAAGIKLT
ncbi:MAG TPA: N-acetylmuramoyl-L-alanine amidase [Pyrinomonadaceae bacterium]|nr:N-acetylmuramoyl-L-alanine amidase [Pyrinomonadaceae bacterium]